MSSTEYAVDNKDVVESSDVKHSSDAEKAAPTPDSPHNATTDIELMINLVKSQDVHHPMHWSAWKRWVIVVVYCSLQVFVTLTSTTYVGVEWLVTEKYGVSNTQVLTLAQSMFIVGTAIGPVFLGPLSDVSGRKWIYVGSILLYAILNFGCAYAINYPMLVIFSFLIGVAGSTALSNVAGTITDLFGDLDGAGQPMALFVASANTGPSIGSPVGEWIGDNASLGLKWIYIINIIIGAAYAIGLCFLPETLPRIVIARAVEKQGTEADREELEVANASLKINVLQEIRFVITTAVKLFFTEPILFFLGIYNGFAYGLLFLYLDGVFDVFAINNGLSYVGADLTYLNFVVSVTIMFCFVPVQTWFYRRDREKHGHNRPEARFITSLVFVWLFPISLFWFAFTSDGSVSYWSPIVAGGFLGFGDPLLWLAMLSYVGDAYPNVIGSAMAAFLAPSFLIAAVLAHLGVLMFENMTTTWAMATLAFVSLTLVAMVYILYFFGPKLRARSKYARKF